MATSLLTSRNASIKKSRSSGGVFMLMFACSSLVTIRMIVLLHRLVHMDCSEQQSNNDILSSMSIIENCGGHHLGNEAPIQHSMTLPTTYTPPTGLSEWKFDYYGPDASIQAYNPANRPLFSASQTKLKVRLFTEVFKKKNVPMNECKHILYDGLLESSMVDFTGITYTSNNVAKEGDWDKSWKDDDLWVLDSHHLLPSCDLIQQWWEKTQTTVTSSSTSHKVRILAVDYGDAPDQLYHCESLAAAVGPDHYRIAKRSIGIDREWNETEQFPSRGRIAPPPQNVSVVHLPYPIRTDVARGIAASVQHAKGGMTNSLLLTTTDRDLDVSHFYARQALVATKAYYDNLRNGINVLLKFLDGMPLAKSQNRTTLNTFAGVAGKDKRQGRNALSNQYVEMMLRSKIIVVAQRDGWSDHYRLMEGLASGAMVICDETLTLPRGLRHGESVVMFASLAELRNQLFYYIQHDEDRIRIAQRGWEVAMSYHRSWHAMESVIFGRVITDNGDPMAAFARDLEDRPPPPPPPPAKQRGRLGRRQGPVTAAAK